MRLNLEIVKEYLRESAFGRITLYTMLKMKIIAAEYLR